MSEKLVKKLYDQKATINDLVEVRAHLEPKHQGFMVPHGMAGNSFFISESYIQVC